VGGDALAGLEQFDGGCGVAGLELLSGELIRNAVVMPVDLDVIVDVGADRFPFRHYVALVRQRLKGRAIHLQEQRGPGALAFAEAPVVETIEQRFDGVVQLGDREEPAVP
jgi:hypothetical protein